MIRVTEANGYESMADVLSVAGVSNRWKGGWKLDFGCVERILNFPPGRLDHLLYAQPGSNRANALLLGQHISRFQLAGAFPRLCPECVEEVGYIEANWDLRLMVACPKHCRLAVFNCHACGQPLSLYRPKMLLCRCGADLREQPVQPANDHLVELQAVLAAAALKRARPKVTNCGMPMAHLAAMSLRTLALTIASIGAHVLGNGENDEKAPERIVEPVARAFCNWPEGFRALLRNVEAQHSSVEGGIAPSFRKTFGQFYESLFKRGLPRDEVDFLRKALVEFGVDEWTDGVVDGRLRRGISTEGRRHQSITHLAREMGVMPSTARKMVAKGLVAMAQFEGEGSKAKRYIGTGSWAKVAKRVDGRSLNVREAAAFLGIPTKVLEDLRTSGQFEVRYIGKTLRSFHHLDVQSFNEKCLAVADRSQIEASSGSAEGAIELGYALKNLHFLAKTGKRDLIIAFLEGRLRCLGRVGDRAKNILLDEEQVREFHLDSRNANFHSARSVREVASRLLCDPAVIRSLADKGYLQALPDADHLRITEVSIATFQDIWVSVNEVAKRHKVGARRALNVCDSCGIGMISGERNGTGQQQFFIQRADEPAISTRLVPSTRKPAVAKPPGPGMVNLLRSYFEDLRQTGSLLPRRAGLPNKLAIAKQAGVDRDVFYGNDGAALLDAYDAEERERVALLKRDDAAALRRYLAALAESGAPLPRMPSGKPNKFVIAKACGFNRNVLYTKPALAAALDEYAQRELEAKNKGA